MVQPAIGPSLSPVVLGSLSAPLGWRVPLEFTSRNLMPSTVPWRFVFVNVQVSTSPACSDAVALRAALSTVLLPDASSLSEHSSADRSHCDPGSSSVTTTSPGFRFSNTFSP